MGEYKSASISEKREEEEEEEEEEERNSNRCAQERGKVT